MNYIDLAKELMQAMLLLKKNKPRVDVSEAMRGGTFILQYLLERREAVLPSEISIEMEISTARIAAALNNLEKKNLIHREINRSDRRQILVTLTAQGEALAEKQRQEMEAHTAHMLQSLGEHDALEFVRILKRIAGFQENP